MADAEHAFSRPFSPAPGGTLGLVLSGARVRQPEGDTLAHSLDRIEAALERLDRLSRTLPLDTPKA